MDEKVRGEGSASPSSAIEKNTSPLPTTEGMVDQGEVTTTRPQTYAWVLLTAVGIPAMILGILYAAGVMINPSLIESELGQTWSSFQLADPNAAAMYLTAVRQWGVTLAVLGVLTIAIAVGPFRKGNKWGWMFLFGQPFYLLYMVIEAAVDGDYTWPVSAGLLVLSVSALLLSYRRFYPRRGATGYVAE